LNLGLRYDFYSNCVSTPTTGVPVGFYNPAPPRNWSQFDFGPPLDPNHPYNNDGGPNLDPRVRFDYSVHGRGTTVDRAALRALLSPQMPAVVRQAVAHPVVPFRVSWSLDEARALGLKFPVYTDEMQNIVERQAASSSRRFPFS